MPRKKIEPVKIPEDKSREIVDDLSSEEVEHIDKNNEDNLTEDPSISEPNEDKSRDVVNSNSDTLVKVEKETINLRKPPDENNRPTTVYEVAPGPKLENNEFIFRFPELSYGKIDELLKSNSDLKSFIVDAQGIENISESDIKLLFYIWEKLSKISGNLIFRNSEGINSILDLTDINFDRE
ncbi:hypothetical protein KKF34_12225 [Myxococcota bacterium]|nr:hypothetical protein [Myxococcota bacterium]MBU1379428.1 hypothetical protein [Myxococcota bacterium]MBU1497631.1 hypothetical protein [Myxococcota bacterium]